MHLESLSSQSDIAHPNQQIASNMSNGLRYRHPNINIVEHVYFSPDLFEANCDNFCHNYIDQ